jgi:hypothetical protein
MSRLLVYLLLLTLVSGCNRQEIATRFWLKDLPDKPAQLPGEVTVQDTRPEWEHRAFQGTFSLVPLENIEPAPVELLQREIEQQTLGLPEPPSKMRLELQSFRVVLSEEDSFLHHDRHYGFAGLNGPCLASGGNTSSGSAACELAFLAVFVIAVAVVDCGTYACDLTTEFVHNQRHVHSRPEEMTDDYARGVTCDVRIKLVTDWANGRRNEMELREVVNHREQEFERGPPYTTSDAVRDSVRDVCEQLARDWREKLLHPESDVGTGKPTPVFSVHSGN